MILSLGFAQFALISLGILALNVLLKANGYAENIASSFPPLAVLLGRHGLWILAVPLAWVAFATICERAGKGGINDKVARVTGVGLIVAIIAVFFYAATTCF
jgi:hypothetical protein